MKKKIFLLSTLILCVCSCSNKENNDDYQHYNLSDRDTLSTFYSYTNDNNQTETYIVTDVTPTESEEIRNALFYKVDDDDYIMLDEFSSCSNPNDYKNQSKNHFSLNKLYITRCSGGIVYEYTLNGTDTKKEDLSNIVNLQNANVKEVKDGYVSFEGIDSSKDTKIVKCSQETYDCYVE